MHAVIHDVMCQVFPTALFGDLVDRLDILFSIGKHEQARELCVEKAFRSRRIQKNSVGQGGVVVYDAIRYAGAHGIPRRPKGASLFGECKCCVAFEYRVAFVIASLSTQREALGGDEDNGLPRIYCLLRNI